MKYLSEGTSTFKPSYLPLVFMLSATLSSYSYTAEEVEVVEVRGQHHSNAISLGAVDQLLKQQGVDFSAAGGMSSLPVLNGMMGERIKVLIDGADVTASCANHMNPPLSYVSANQIQSSDVVAGISPVSVAGDNIAGVISVKQIAPLYNEGNALDWHSGYITAQYLSNNEAKSVGLGARVASATLSFDYQGAFEDAHSYEDGHGNTVLDTLYRVQNHAVTAAIRNDREQFAIKLSHQNIPFQGFANQYMDMTDNKSVGLTGLYQRQFDAGELEAQVNWHGVKHEMGFFTPEKTGMMPMNTDADDYSYRLTWLAKRDNQQTLRVGHEYFDYRLNDWWPALEGSMMMGPNDYKNITDGRRQRIGIFAELEQTLSSTLWVSAGLRFEQVRTNVGDVQAYGDDSGGMGMGMGSDMDMGSDMGMGSDMDMGSGMDMGSDMDMDSDMDMRNTSNYIAAQAFNALDRKRNDSLIDGTLLLRYQLSADQQIEFGLARKNRAPSLYERYSWGVSTMSTMMIGWFGDANGYIGDPDLKPETAHTLSATYSQTASNKDWQVSANFWYTSVKDYIDATAIDTFNLGPNDAGLRNTLQLSNVDATLYGTKLRSMLQVADSENWGQWQIAANLTTTHGERDDSDQNLYQIVPLQTEVTLSQQNGNWQNTIAWQFVDSKRDVDNSRLENTTDSYHLLNLESKLTWQQLTLSLAVKNALNSYYELPMGGVSIAQYNTDRSQGFNQLAGSGRSFNVGVSYAF